MYVEGDNRLDRKSRNRNKLTAAQVNKASSSTNTAVSHDLLIFTAACGSSFLWRGLQFFGGLRLRGLYGGLRRLRSAAEGSSSKGARSFRGQKILEPGHSLLALSFFLHYIGPAVIEFYSIFGFKKCGFEPIGYIGAFGGV